MDGLRAHRCAQGGVLIVTDFMPGFMLLDCCCDDLLLAVRCLTGKLHVYVYMLHTCVWLPLFTMLSITNALDAYAYVAQAQGLESY
eukprot:6491684-Amphidinium_carterae.4